MIFSNQISMKIKKTITRNEGFTLIEMIIGIVVMVIIAGLVAMVIQTSFNTFEHVKSRKDLILDGSTATQRFTREIRDMTDLLAASDTAIVFEYHSSEVVTYSITDSTFTRQLSTEASAGVLSFNLDGSNCGFSYFDIDHNELSTFPLSYADRQLVWMVELVLRLSSNGQSVQYIANGFPENYALD